MIQLVLHCKATKLVGCCVSFPTYRPVGTSRVHPGQKPFAGNVAEKKATRLGTKSRDQGKIYEAQQNCGDIRIFGT